MWCFGFQVLNLREQAAAAAAAEEVRSDGNDEDDVWDIKKSQEMLKHKQFVHIKQSAWKIK